MCRFDLQGPDIDKGAVSQAAIVFLQDALDRSAAPGFADQPVPAEIAAGANGAFLSLGSLFLPGSTAISRAGRTGLDSTKRPGARSS